MDLSKFQSNGKFLMLALDHRGSFKKLMNPSSPDAVSDEQIIQLKNEIIDSLKDQFSALLIDETWGLEACHEVCLVKPFLLPLEKSSHTGITELEYSVEQVKQMGASGAKLLLYFNPQAESAQKQIDIARRVAEECKREDFPLFLEIVGSTKVQMFIDAGVTPSVWKLEYPGSAEKCQELTKLVGQTLWILLTGGQTFDAFKPQLEIASQNGCQGFLAGRALWQEVTTLHGEEKQKFLNETLPARFKELVQVSQKQTGN